MNILRDGKKHYFYNDLIIVEKLEATNYVFDFDANYNRCWLEQTDDFSFPEKIYDIDSELIDFVVSDFNGGYENNLGVLLTGNKGQGKSMTAKLICKELNVPVIMITKTIPKNIDFINFLSTIKQPYVLFVDEFEKLFESNRYDANEEEHSQDSFLSFMDGSLSSNSRILFLLTTNDDVNDKLINRPSRIKYVKNYEELPEEVFDQIAKDRLIDHDYFDDLKDNVSLINLNVDLLITIIDNINRFDKPFSSFSHIFNYSFEKYRYEIFITKRGKKEEFADFYTSEKRIKPTQKRIAGYEVNILKENNTDEIIFESWEWGGQDKETMQVRVKRVNEKELISRLVF